MGFEKFEKGSFRGTATEQISIRQSGTVGISSLVMDEYFDEVDGAVVYYDEESNQVGFEPADPSEDSDAYKLNNTSGSGSLQVKSFLKRYDLIPEETTRYEPEWDDELGFVVIDLDQPIE